MQRQHLRSLSGLGYFGILAVLGCALVAGESTARGAVVGYNQVNNFAATFIGYSGGGNVQSTEGLAYSGDTPTAPPESSAVWTFGSPTDIRSLVIFPNAGAQNVSPADYNFRIHQNGNPVYDGTIANTPDVAAFKPTIVNQSLLATNTLKTQTTDLTRQTCCGFAELRDIFPTLAFSEAMGDLVSPTAVSSNVGWNNLNLTIDDTRNVAITTISGSVANAQVTFNFGSPRTLSGVLVNINPIDDPTAFAWHTWDLKSACGGTILATKGPSTDRYQFIEFAGGPLTLSSITLEGPMNDDTGVSGRGRLGELWGVDALLPTVSGSPTNVDLGGANAFTTKLVSDAVLVSNVGEVGSRLDITGYTITGADAAQFSLIGFTPISLRVGELDSTTFDIQFSALSAPSYSALLTFQTNAGSIEFNLSAETTPAPEPASGLVLLGLGGLFCIRRRAKV